MHRRTLLKAGLVVPAAAATGAALTASTASAAPRIGKVLATGLSYPWGIGFLPDRSALVTERNSGRVLRVLPSGARTVVGTVPGVYNDGGEGGLMGLALSPSFASDRWVYVFHTTTTDNRIVRMRYDTATHTIGAPQVILAGIPRGTTHNGGGLWFTSTPSLYATTGDTRNSALAQNKASLAGKVLRMKMDGSPQRGNPFGSRVYSYGHRNPEGITQTVDGRILASELGENTWDELNQIVAGGNYGWPRVEGRDGRGGFRDPISQWHPVNCSPSGIAVRTGVAYIGALRGQSLWAVDVHGPGYGTRTRHFQGEFGRLRLVKNAPDGSIWIGTSNNDGNDKLVRIDFA
jgi:glucose/arabinose dehydrogenase